MVDPIFDVPIEFLLRENMDVHHFALITHTRKKFVEQEVEILEEGFRVFCRSVCLPRAAMFDPSN